MIKRIRQTKQKRILNEELNNINIFFTAETLYDRTKKRDKDIGIATIYRFLKQLRKENKICSYICEGKQIYSKDKNNHCHFRCHICNSIKHISLDSIDFLKKKIDESICHFQIDIEGICKDCEK